MGVARGGQGGQVPPQRKEDRFFSKEDRFFFWCFHKNTRKFIHTNSTISTRCGYFDTSGSTDGHSTGFGPRHPAWIPQLRCSLGQAPPDMVPSTPQAKNPSYAPVNNWRNDVLWLVIDIHCLFLRLILRLTKIQIFNRKVNRD